MNNKSARKKNSQTPEHNKKRINTFTLPVFCTEALFNCLCVSVCAFLSPPAGKCITTIHTKPILFNIDPYLFKQNSPKTKFSLITPSSTLFPLFSFPLFDNFFKNKIFHNPKVRRNLVDQPKPCFLLIPCLPGEVEIVVRISKRDFVFRPNTDWFVFI